MQGRRRAKQCLAAPDTNPTSGLRPTAPRAARDRTGSSGTSLEPETLRSSHELDPVLVDGDAHRLGDVRRI